MSIYKKPVDQHALDTLFLEGRSHNSWLETPVADTVLKEIYNLCRMGPTSVNCSPLRIIYLKSPKEKEKLIPHLAEGNRNKTESAPVVAILAYDLEFYNHQSFLFPHKDTKAMFEGKDNYIYETAFRNGTLQAGYFIMAARALGLDCGPMSGFDPTGVNNTFLKDTSYHVNFLCNIGYGDTDTLYPRAPRFDFDTVCEIR